MAQSMGVRLPSEKEAQLLETLLREIHAIKTEDKVPQGILDLSWQRVIMQSAFDNEEATVVLERAISVAFARGQIA